MEPLGHCAIRFWHLGDLRQHGGLPLPLASLHLLDAVPYRASFLLSESLSRGTGALGRLLRALLCRFHGFFSSSELKNFSLIHSFRFNHSRTFASPTHP